MASSTVSAFLSTLRTNLQGRSGLSGVRIDLVPTGDTSSIEAITLVTGRIEGEQTYDGATAGRRRDTHSIPGLIDTAANGPDSDVNFTTAMDRAAAILEEVIQEIRDNKPAVGSMQLEALVTNIGYTPLARDQGGLVARCDFTIEYSVLVP